VTGSSRWGRRPKDDDNLELLLAELKQTGKISKEQAMTAMGQLGVPHSLAGVWPIAKHLREVLPTCRMLDPDNDAAFAVQEIWLDALEALPDESPLSMADLLRGVILESPTEPGGPSRTRLARPIEPPFFGLKQSHPVWITLWLSSGTDKDSPMAEQRASTFRLIQAVFLCVRMRLHASNDPMISQRFASAGRLLRSIHMPEKGQDLDRWTATDLNGAFKYCAKRHDDNPTECGNYGALAELLRLAYKFSLYPVFLEREVVDVLRTKSHRRKGVEATMIYPDHALYWELRGQFFGPSSLVPDPVLIESCGPEGSDLENLIAAGGCGAEFRVFTGTLINSGAFVDPPRIGQKPGKLPPLGALFAAARGRYRRMVMDAQLFTTRRSRPTVPLLVAVVSALDSLRDQELPSEDISLQTSPAVPAQEEALREEVTWLAGLMLLHGMSIDEVLHTCRFRSIGELPDRWVLTFSVEHLFWIRPYDPPERNPLSAAVDRQSIEVRPRVVLSDVWGFGHLLSQRPGDRWFERRKDVYQRAFKKYIEPALTNAGVPEAWATAKGISDLLPAWFLGTEEGDQLRVCAIFGRRMPEAVTQSHYVALDRPALDQYYRQVMWDLAERMTANGYAFRGRLFFSSPHEVIPSSRCGNDWAPPLPPIGDLVGILKERIRRIKELDLFQRHNLVVAYLGVVLSLVTAARSIKTPIVDLRQIEMETGLLALMEKEREDGAHARVVFVPESVREQVQIYLSFLKGQRAAMPARVPSRAKFPATKFRDRRRADDDGTFTLDLSGTLFFYAQSENGEWRPAEFTGARLKAALEVYLAGTWPIDNAGRHIAASQYFGSAKAHGNLIRALMGHWELGESPWDPTSAFDPYALCRAMAPHLDRLLDGIGFEVMSF
jgi:hypothetical protein